MNTVQLEKLIHKVEKNEEHIRNAWLKTQAQLGDFGREILSSHERINKLKRRVTELENKTTEEK